MANLLSRFNKISVGSKGKLSDFTAKIASTGDFSRIEGMSVILNSWSNILVTPLRTYTFSPEFGSNLYKFIFEPVDEETANNIKDEVYYRISINDDRAKISSVNVFFLTNKKGFAVNVTALFEGEKADLTAVIDENIYFNFLRTS